MKKIKRYLSNKLYEFAEWFFKKLYDEPTYEELETKVYRLEREIDELEEEVDYYKEAMRHR